MNLFYYVYFTNLLGQTQIISFIVLYNEWHWTSERPSNSSKIYTANKWKGIDSNASDKILRCYSFHYTKQLFVPAPMMSYRFLRPYIFKAYCLFTLHPDLLPYFLFNPLTQTGVLRHAKSLLLWGLLSQPPDKNWLECSPSIPFMCARWGAHEHRGNNFYIFSSFSAYIDHTSAWWGEGVKGLTQEMSQQPHFCPMERSVFSLDPHGEAPFLSKWVPWRVKLRQCYLLVVT